MKNISNEGQATHNTYSVSPVIWHVSIVLQPHWWWKG